MSFIKALPTFRSGQVFEVIANELTKKFLICVIEQEVLFKGEKQRIVFVKDVTFGVLYE